MLQLVKETNRYEANNKGKMVVPESVDRDIWERRLKVSFSAWSSASFSWSLDWAKCSSDSRSAIWSSCRSISKWFSLWLNSDAKTPWNSVPSHPSSLTWSCNGISLSNPHWTREDERAKTKAAEVPNRMRGSYFLDSSTNYPQKKNQSFFIKKLSHRILGT